MCLKSHWFIERFPNKKISLDLRSACACVWCERVPQINYTACWGFKREKERRKKNLASDKYTLKKTPETFQFSLYLHLSLFLSHLPHAGRAAENSDCTVVRHRVTLTGRYNKASFVPQRERDRETYRTKGDKEGYGKWREAGSFHLHHYLLKRHFRPRSGGLWESGQGSQGGKRNTSRVTQRVHQRLFMSWQTLSFRSAL